MSPAEFGALCAQTGQASIGSGFGKRPNHPPGPMLGAERLAQKPIVLELPYPLSTNRIWNPITIRDKKTGKARSLNVLTGEAKAYKARIAQICALAGVVKIFGRIELEMWLYPQRPADWEKRRLKDPETWDDTVRCIDTDNGEKLVIDALKEIAFEDDKRVRRKTIEVMEPDGAARLVVRISPYQK